MADAGIEHIVFADDGRFPNSVLPLILYPGAIRPDAASSEAFEALFADNGWPPRWRASVFTWHHYHSTSHEVLGVARGTAAITFGGPEGRTVEVAAGDAVLIPAGVAHKREHATGDFLVVGAYPPGMDWDLLRGEPGERPAADRNIAAVPLPESDPVAGGEGPAMRLWRA